MIIPFPRERIFDPLAPARGFELSREAAAAFSRGREPMESSASVEPRRRRQHGAPRRAPASKIAIRRMGDPFHFRAPGNHLNAR